MSESALKSKPKDSRTARHANSRTRDSGTYSSPRSTNGQLSDFYAAGPLFLLGTPAQAKVTIGRPHDPYEREADAVANRVAVGLPAPGISHLPANGLGRVTQRQEEEEPVQPQAEEEESVQESTVQRQADEEEPVQEVTIQRQADEEEPVQELAVQRQGEAGEEPVQEQIIQSQEEEESVQEVVIQRQADEDEPVQELAIQRQAEDEEGPVQKWAIQLQNEEEPDITAQAVGQDRPGAGPGSSQPSMATAASHAIRHSGPGAPMNPNTRHTLESRLGADLRDVRIHDGSLAHQANAILKARAFTHKNHIWLARGESQHDLRLMAHETTHVLQQDGVVRRQPVAEDRLKEEEAAGLDGSMASDSLVTPPEKAPEAAALTATLAAGETSAGLMSSPAPVETIVMAEAAPETKTQTVEKARTETETAISEAEESPAATTEVVPEAVVATEAEETERLQEVMERLEEAADQQEGPAAAPTSQSRAARSAASAASAATPSPTNEAEAMGQASQVETMGEQEAGEVDQQSFLALVRQKLAELDLPDNPKEMDEFSESDGASGLRQEVMGGVTQQTEGAQGDIRQATEAEPTPAETREATPLPDETSPTMPSLQAEEALPQPRPEQTVTGPLQENKQAVDEQFEAAKQAEKRLERPNDPRYVEVQAAQEELHAQVENAPEAYRQEEQALLTGQENAIAVEENTTAHEMEQARTQSDQARGANQQVAMTQEARERQQISDRIEGIYTETQQAVEERLDSLDEDVDQRFTDGEARARERFESYVDDEMSDWKWERYGRRALIPVVGAVVAAGTWLHDQWVGINNFPEIIQIFEDGRQQYLAELDEVIVDIADLVDETLAWCQERIQQGQDEIQAYVDSLPEAQRQIGEETANSVSSRFDQLRHTVENRREELANRLVQRYQESREALDTRIQEMQEENSGLRDDFNNLMEDVLSALRDLRDILPNLARNIPGYTLFTVVIGFNPLTGENVDRNAMNLLEGLMGLVPFGTFIFDTLQERGVLQEAFDWVEGELGRLDLSQERIEETIDAAWEDIHIAEGISYNLEVLERHFGQLLIDVTTFALSLVDYLIQLIKNTAIDIVDELLADNQAWALIKKILHHDPLKDVPVDATTAEIIEDFLMLIGKEQELEQMREQGTIEETAAWLDTQLGTFLSLLDELGGLFSEAWEAIQPQNLPNLMSNLENLAPRVVGFLQRVWDFALTVAAKVFELIKDALLGWLRSHANEIPGYHLLTVILEKDVFTQEDVPRTPTNLIRGFMSLVPGGEQQFQQMQESGVIPRAAQRIESLISDLGISWSFIRDLFLGIWDSLSIEDLLDPIGAFTRIMDRFGEPLGRLFTFVIEVIKVVLELVLRMMGFPFELIESIISNALQAIEDIKQDPVGFLKNMLEAVKLGFSNFFDNILTHLINGLADWLFRGLRDAGVEPPADLTLPSILGFVLELLGISMERIWEKLAERIGQETVDRIRGAIDRLVGIWNFVRDVQERGVVAIWEYIESQISNLWNMVLQKAQEWIMEKIITRVTARLLSMLDPTGVMAVVNSFLAFFNAVQSAIEYIREILEIVNDYVSTIAAVARGEIQPGAQKMEQGLANAIPVAIGFLANQVGLGNIGEKMREIIGGVREVIDRALDWLIDRAVSMGRALLQTLGLGGEEEGATGPDGQISDSVVGDTISFSGGNEGHRLYVSVNGAQVELMVASTTPMSLSQRLDRWESERSTLDSPQQAEAGSLIATVRNQYNLVVREGEEANQAITQAQQTPTDENTSQARQQDDEVEAAERAMTPELGRLFDIFEGGVPFIPIEQTISLVNGSDQLVVRPDSNGRLDVFIQSQAVRSLFIGLITGPLGSAIHNHGAVLAEQIAEGADPHLEAINTVRVNDGKVPSSALPNLSSHATAVKQQLERFGTPMKIGSLRRMLVVEPTRLFLRTFAQQMGNHPTITAEYDRQLNEQQRGMNQLTVDRWIVNRNAYTLPQQDLENLDQNERQTVLQELRSRAEQAQQTATRRKQQYEQAADEIQKALDDPDYVPNFNKLSRVTGRFGNERAWRRRHREGISALLQELRDSTNNWQLVFQRTAVLHNADQIAGGFGTIPAIDRVSPPAAGESEAAWQAYLDQLRPYVGSFRINSGIGPLWQDQSDGLESDVRAEYPREGWPIWRMNVELRRV